MAVHYMPEGYNSVTPYLIAKDAQRVLDFVKSTFDAQELFRMPAPGGKIGHAEFRIGNCTIMIADASDMYPAMPCTLYVYVPDVDETYKRALAAGAASQKAPANQFYGDRSASVTDPSGNVWGIGTHIEDVSPEELERRAKEAHKPQ